MAHAEGGMPDKTGVPPYSFPHSRNSEVMQSQLRRAKFFCGFGAS
ncbi:hypothetical protein [Methyloceanibacter stevinii]|nr:hypothetical protein [Methyloceanibacter stevinii]